METDKPITAINSVNVNKSLYGPETDHPPVDNVDLSYISEDFTVSISTDEYIRRFRDTDRCMGYCRECPNYNRIWACPPFGHNLESQLRGCHNLLLVATKITPLRPGLPLAEYRRLILPERKRLEGRLLEMERLYGGRGFANVGSCLYCPEGSCTRPQGLPCRHPELVRPSLEAYGFDISRTASELFGIELLWGENGVLPDYLTLVCGLFHNGGEIKF